MRLLVFDLDGTITEQKKQISQEMISLFSRICATNEVWLTTGADISGVKRQLGNLLNQIDKVFTCYSIETIPNYKLRVSKEAYEYFKDYTAIVDRHKLSLQTVSSVETRQHMVKLFKEDLPELEFYVSGRRSIDILPRGVSKHMALAHITHEFHYFGDEFHEFGNDATIVSNKHAIIHRVNSPDETKQILESML